MISQERPGEVLTVIALVVVYCGSSHLWKTLVDVLQLGSHQHQVAFLRVELGRAFDPESPFLCLSQHKLQHPMQNHDYLPQRSLDLSMLQRQSGTQLGTVGELHFLGEG